jgi:hypothetical protein
MKRRIGYLTLYLIVFVGLLGTVSIGSSRAQGEKTGVYDLNPTHIWNRVYRQFYVRAGQDGVEYGGEDQLDPLLWVETKHLLEGISYSDTIRLLDEFLTSHAEQLITEPLKRAMFQRDLWAVFDWSVNKHDALVTQRQALQIRLVQIMQRVALSEEQIQRLPDNYALAVASDTFPASYNEDERTQFFSRLICFNLVVSG